MIRCIEMAIVWLLRFSGHHAWTLAWMGDSGGMEISVRLLAVGIGTAVALGVAVALAISRPGGRKESQ